MSEIAHRAISMISAPRLTTPARARRYAVTHDGQGGGAFSLLRRPMALATPRYRFTPTRPTMHFALVSGFLAALPRRQLSRLWAALLIAALAGCAELPKDVQRPVTTALETSAGTPLATLVNERRAAANARFESGFLLLAGPQAAYGSRLARGEAAGYTLDLQ